MIDNVKIIPKKKQLVMCIGICVILFLVGLYVLLNSVSFSRSELGNFVSSLNYSLREEQYDIILEGYIRNKQIIGGVLASAGALGTILFSHSFVSKQ